MGGGQWAAGWLGPGLPLKLQVQNPKLKPVHLRGTNISALLLAEPPASPSNPSPPPPQQSGGFGGSQAQRRGVSEDALQFGNYHINVNGSYQAAAAGPTHHHQLADGDSMGSEVRYTELQVFCTAGVSQGEPEAMALDACACLPAAGRLVGAALWPLSPTLSP